MKFADATNWQRMKYSIPSLIMAELAIYVTPLKDFIPYSEILYLIPAISMLGNRKPFSFPLFLFLILLNLTPYLYGSEVVKGIVNLADYAGIGYVYEIYQLFGLYRGIESAMLPVVLLFSISEVSWWAAREAADAETFSDRIFSVRIAYSFLMGAVAVVLAYRIPELASSIGLGYPPLVLGLLGAAALFLAVILLR